MNELTTVVDSPYEAARGAHAIVVLTEWDEFKRLSTEVSLYPIPVLSIPIIIVTVYYHNYQSLYYYINLQDIMNICILIYHSGK